MATQQLFSFLLADESTSPATAAAERVPERADLVRRLRAQVGCLSTPSPADPEQLFSTGCPGLDRLLPLGGLRNGTLTEWVSASGCEGTAAVALAVVASHLRWLQNLGGESAGGPLVVVDPDGTFYPPAAVALGIAAERILWCRPPSRAEAVWAIDQALRCRAVAAVWSSLGAWLDDRDARRLQLAAEVGDTAGFWVRPAAVRHRPTFAETRFHVALDPATDTSVSAAGCLPAGSRRFDSAAAVLPEPKNSPGEPWRLRVTLDRCRGGQVGQSTRLAIDPHGRLRDLTASPPASRTALPLEVTRHETAALHLASRLADPTLSQSPAAGRRRRRA